MRGQFWSRDEMELIAESLGAPINRVAAPIRVGTGPGHGLERLVGSLRARQGQHRRGEDECGPMPQIPRI